MPLLLTNKRLNVRLFLKITLYNPSKSCVFAKKYEIHQYFRYFFKKNGCAFLLNLLQYMVEFFKCFLKSNGMEAFTQWILKTLQ